MLTRIGLKNFKLHADTFIDGAPLTVLIGPNNSGKSSIFQALLLWRQSAARNSPSLCTGWSRQPGQSSPYFFSEDQLIDLGDFDQVLRRGEREVSISLSGKCQPSKNIEYGPGPTDRSFEVGIRDNRLVYHRGEQTYEIQPLKKRGQLAWDWRRGRVTGPQVLTLDFPAGKATVQVQCSETLALFASSGLGFQGTVPPEAPQAVPELAAQISESALNLLTSIHPVYPIRGFEEAEYPLAPAETLDRMALRDRTIALVSLLAYNRGIERRLSAWLEKLIGIKIEVKLLPGNRGRILTMLAESRRPDSLFSNEGTGASQLPFILVPIGLAAEGETILLGEPEVHLHPRLQVQLTKLLVELAKKEKKQFLIETHSEHVLHALLNSIATGALQTSELKIYYFEEKDGKAVCAPLLVNQRGQVEGGLPGFFDQSLGELAEYLEALKTK